MDITLLYLPHPYLRQPNAQVPLGILYLKSVLDFAADITVTVKNYSAYTIEEAIKDLPKSDIFGITVTSLELPIANEFAKHIKEKYPKSKVILGGPGIDKHRTFLDYIDLNYISSCLIGEGEVTIFEVIRDYKETGHLKICYNGKAVRNLDDIPFPNRFCLDGEIGGNIFAYDKNYKGNQSTTILTSRGCPFKCLHEDTLVNTIEGKIKIKDLVGKENVKVMTRDLTTKEVLFADATNICKTSENEKLVRVTFDDNSYIDCTPDHKFMAFKNGNQFTETTEEEIEAIDLKKGQSVRAIHYGTNGYKKYIAVSWGRRKSKRLHRMVMEGILGRKLLKNEHIHHIDGNVNNNLPDNLILTNKNEHISKYHPEISERMKGENNPIHLLSKEELIERGKSQKGKKRSFESRLKYRESKLGDKNPNYTDGKTSGNRKSRIKELNDPNHKIKSVEFIDGLYDTYCMTVEGYNWFYANDVLVHNCAFCASPKFHGVKPVRFRSPENVYNEMRLVKEVFGISQFRISDDMFLSRPMKDVEYLCKLIKSLDVVWRISTRVKPFDAKIAKMIRDAGCVEASFGVESFDDEVLKGLNKRTTAADNVEALKVAAAEGITSRVLFMTRTPFQTSKTVDINISFLEKTPYDIIACTSFVPLPGSDIWVNPDKYNIEILTKDLSKYNFYFWSKDGENELHDIIRLKGRDLDCLNQETKEFKDYLKATGKLNMG